MKNLVFKDTLREIRKTKSRYFSIFAIVFIGVAFFSGILAIGPDMRYSVDDYYDDYHLMDVRVVSTLGITENDIAELKKIEELKGIQPAYSVDVFARLAGVEQVVRVHSYNMSDAFSNSDNYLNRLVIKEGRMPNKPNECVIEYGKMMASGFQVGDTISLYSHDDLSETLTRTQYTIVGMVNTPYYLSFQKGSSELGGGTLNTFIYVDESNFCMDVYTEVFMTFEGLDEYNSYNQEYFDQLDPVTDRLKALGIVRSEIRTNEILDDAYAQLNDAKQQYQDGVNEFDDKIADAEKQIADGQDEILLGKSQIATAKILLESTIQTSESQINMLEEQIVTYEKQYETYKKQFEDRNQQALDQKETLKKQNETLKSQMDEKQSEYDGIVAQIEELNQKEATLQNQYDQKND
jgi:putative ABC transport system permease protein